MSICVLAAALFLFTGPGGLAEAPQARSKPVAELAQRDWDEGRLHEALAGFRKAAALREAGDPALPELISHTAELLRILGRYREAEKLARQVLVLRRHMHAPDYPDVSAGLNNLAEILSSEERYREAEALYRESLDICLRQTDPGNADVAAVMSNLARVLIFRKHHEEAERRLRQAIAIQEHNPAAGPGPIPAWNNLALLLQERGRLDEAESLFRRVLAWYAAAPGPERLEAVLARINLAELLRRKGRYEESERLFLGALPDLEARLGTDHPQSAGAMRLYAGLLHQTGRKREARRLRAESAEAERRHRRTDGWNAVVVARRR